MPGKQLQHMARGHNLRRARQAEHVVRGYQTHGDGLQTQLVDLLTDLQHFCAASGIDFHEALRISTDHFRCETRDVSGQPSLTEHGK